MHSDGRCLPCAAYTHTHTSLQSLPYPYVYSSTAATSATAMYVTVCRPAYNNSKFVYSTFRNKTNANTKGKRITHYSTGRRERENRLNQNQSAFKF